MTDLRKAAEKVLRENKPHGEFLEALDELRQALAQPKQYDQTALELCDKCGWKAIIPDEGCLVCARKNQEPVAYVSDSGSIAVIVGGLDIDDDTPLYLSPPKREWVGLTDEEIYKILNMKTGDAVKIARAIEAKLKEKNT